MHQNQLLRAAVAGGILVSTACATNTQAQSADALIKKLVDKGLLTTKEAEDLRKETDQDFGKAYARKNGMPDWVTSLKFSGDFRMRYEGHYADNPAFVDRNRARYRVRFGAYVTLLDDFEIGMRLASGDPVSGFSNNAGNPLSGSTTFQDNGTRKFVYFDLAYAKWMPHGTDWSSTFTVGKMDLPFVFSHVVFDPDYNPEGLAGQFTYKLAENHAVKGNLGGFVLDELSRDSDDPYLLGAQLRLDSQWTKRISTSVGIAGLAIMGDEALNNENVPNVNRGNTRNATGAPAYNFNPIVADASVTYALDSFPAYHGAFPIKAGGEFMHNPAAPEKESAFAAGIVFGKMGKKGNWEISYQYRYIGADSWYEELPDDDFGGFYQVQQANAGFSGAGGGFGGGTNVRGHVIKAFYSLFDSLVLGVTYYDGRLINELPGGSKNHAGHLLADLIWKF